jgi:putative nucleotidyltransferase with HDIG domain
MLHRAGRPITPITATAFGVAMAALLLIALFPVFPRDIQVRVNDIAQRTIRAPEGKSFQSQFLTDQARQEAADAVPPTLVFDPNIRSTQLLSYDRETAQVTQSRALTDDARRRQQLASLGLSERSLDTVLAMTDERWQATAEEGRRVLTSALANSMDAAAATQTKDGIDATISAAFTADEALLTAELVRPLIQPTLVVDEGRTQEARDAARLGTPPQLVSLQKGDVIVAAESRVDEVAIEKMRATGLLSSGVDWRNVLAVAIVSAIAAAALAAYLYVIQPPGVTSERHMIALAIVTMLPLLVAKFFLPIVLPDEGRYFLAFTLPVAAAPMLVAALLDVETGLVVGAITGALLAMITALLPDVSLVASVGSLDTFQILAVYTLGPLPGLFLVHRADRLSRYFTAGVAVALATFLILLATWFMDNQSENADLLWMTIASGVSGISSGVLAAGAFVSVGMVFGVTTRVQLMELAQLNAPLLRRLQDEAPGTFHHSVIVGNLAERAADLVGADPLLTRVGCYYHDIGKVLQPGMYIENQMSGVSPHDTMTPDESASVIKQHVSEGAELARRQGLPERVRAFIPEHHGTRLVAYFYRKAAEQDPGIDPAAFTYPGPRPQSKETAIVMLADSTEAVVRASPDRSPERIDQLVDEVVAERLAEGQLDESDLTLRDLRTIAESFKSTMRAVYHPRVQYPEPTALEARRRVLRLPLLNNQGRTPVPPVTPARRRR